MRFGDRVRLLDDLPCNPKVYGNDLPASYLVVGRVEAESPTDRSSLVGALSQSACEMGADGLIELQMGTYDTVKSQLDQATRESTIEKGPKLHAATALAVKVLDPTLVKTAPVPAAAQCAPCPTCQTTVAPPAPTEPTEVVPAPKVEEKAPRSDEELPPPPPPPVFDDP